MNPAWITLIAGAGSALAVSCLCSLLEAALLSISPSQIAQLSRQNQRLGDLCRQLKLGVENSLAVILICNTAAHTIGAAVAGSAFSELFGARWLGVFSLAFTLVMVQYTEILPKTLGVRFNVGVMSGAAKPLFFMVIVFKPMIKLIHLINRPFERKYSGGPNAMEEIAALAALARTSEQISSRQERIINAVPQLSKRSAAQIMIPVEQISFLSTNQSLGDAISCSQTEFHTRYPVCESGDEDRVVGYVNFKEVVAVSHNNNSSRTLSDIVRPIHFAEANDPVSSLLELFMAQRCRMAIVRANTGRTLGLITLEDVLEELVGDLDDEFDPLPRTFYAINESSWVIGGGVSMTQLRRDTELQLPRRSEPVAMWFSRMVKHQLRIGETYQHGNAELCVRKIRRGRALEFTLKKLAIRVAEEEREEEK